ncbi:E2/UBC family protein [Mucilaginibacter sp. CAU 1740]|uniref:E2/UBC family protein n=1 Tax=Mucilaginibacter sp. CAU 1740 TaxID=3140365 RepID=UPI00325C0DA5
MKLGHELIIEQLTELGYEAISYPDHPQYPGGFVALKFKVPVGRFRGQEIEVAVNAPQFPAIPPSGPYIKPHLLPIQGGNTLPFDGIHARLVPTPDFQYWSRPYQDWVGTDQHIRTYISFLKALLDFE